MKEKVTEFQIIARLLGTLLMFLGVFELSSIIVAISFSESSSIWSFSMAFLLIEAVGILLYKYGKVKEDGSLRRRTAIATVALSWLAVGFFGSIPFIFDGAILNPVDAFFETVSGFTTTGSTILTDIEALSKTALFWRSIIQWIGGMGIIVLFIAIFPQMGVGAKHMFKSEVPGPITEGLKPKIKETSSMLWRIYLALTALLVLLLKLSGLSFYDAICHAFTTMATGGFSTYNASIKHFDSALIDIIITIFMFLAGVNFSLYYFMKGRNFKQFFRNAELRTYFYITAVVSFIVAISILSRYDYNPLQAIRFASFQVVSVITTTGFATDDFNVYPAIAKVLIIIVMAIGASAGSTAGGIKISRVMIGIKSIYLEIYKTFRPQYVKLVKMNGSAVQSDIIRSILAFIVLFLLTLVFGTVFMTSIGLDIEAAFSSTLTALANVGPGLGKVGPIENFAFIPMFGKLFLSQCMILGRLEFYTLLILLLPSFWDR